MRSACVTIAFSEDQSIIVIPIVVDTCSSFDSLGAIRPIADILETRIDFFALSNCKNQKAKSFEFETYGYFFARCSLEKRQVVIGKFRQRNFFYKLKLQFCVVFC